MHKILKVQGNKTAKWVTIPNIFANALNINKDDKVKVEVKAGKVIITKVEK